MSEYPRTEIGKKMRRADGVMMEEVIVTDFDKKKNKVVVKSHYRPGKRVVVHCFRP